MDKERKEITEANLKFVLKVFLKVKQRLKYRPTVSSFTPVILEMEN